MHHPGHDGRAGWAEEMAARGEDSTGMSNPKLVELIRPDLFDWSDAGDDLTGYDACFFCLGASSAGMSEADYARTTHDLTIAAATGLAPLNPQMTFVYVSGHGTDSTEKGRVMWARVKGRTENALLRPVMPLLRRIFPEAIVTTAEMGKAMLRVARDGHPQAVLEARDIAARARQPSPRFA